MRLTGGLSQENFTPLGECPDGGLRLWILSLLRYYAAPVMHHAILEAQPKSVDPFEDLDIRMICNAAGGLLPSLAVELSTRFGHAVVLPCYGMTE